jgi:hypothetical protein
MSPTIEVSEEFIAEIDGHIAEIDGPTAEIRPHRGGREPRGVPQGTRPPL